MLLSIGTAADDCVRLSGLPQLEADDLVVQKMELGSRGHKMTVLV